MTNKTDVANVRGFAESIEKESGSAEVHDSAKKKFVEPEITVSVDILEATTFFQVASSGATN